MSNPSAPTLTDVIETVKSTAADLADVPKILAALHHRHAGHGHLHQADTEVPARILDRCAEECSEAAQLVRALAGGAS